MLYHIAYFFRESVHLLNVIHYVSFRAMAALLTALILSFLFGNRYIKLSGRLFRSQARENTPEAHQAKNDMPTMGGVFMIAVAFFTTLLWCNLGRPEVWIALWCLIGFGAIGFWDDWGKISRRKGISERLKFYAQNGVAFSVVCFWLYFVCPSTHLCVPFLKGFNPELGLWILPWAVFILVGASNAVNLTDGLDGLAIGSLISAFGTFSVIAYVAGHAAFAHYLHIPYAGTAEIAILGAALVGTSLGFLWYNAYPAQIFMGDVGALSLGAVLALMAIMTRQELLLPLAGGVFVVETVSVILQVFSYKFLKRRIFKMAPIHHHFELLGWPEAKITVRFAIITIVLCLITLMTLKIR